MNGDPSSPPAAPPFLPADAWAQISDTLQKQLRAEATQLNLEYRTRLDSEVVKIAGELKKEAFERVQAVVLGVIAAVAAAFSILAYVQIQSLNTTSTGYYNSVIGLQTQVLATSANLGEKVSLIAAANKELETVTKQVREAQSDLQSVRQELNKTSAELTSAKSLLSSTLTEYDSRLKELKNATARLVEAQLKEASNVPSNSAAAPSADTSSQPAKAGDDES